MLHILATIIAYRSSKIAVSAMTRIQQREFNKDSRQDLIANSVHPVPFFLILYIYVFINAKVIN